MYLFDPCMTHVRPCDVPDDIGRRLPDLGVALDTGLLRAVAAGERGGWPEALVKAPPA